LSYGDEKLQTNLFVERELQVLTNRLSLVISRVIFEHQTDFIKGKYILDGVVILHEVIHEISKRKESGILFKVAFEKAYDKVRWAFFVSNACSEGFW
jgi:hypothetical protein